MARVHLFTGQCNHGQRRNSARDNSSDLSNLTQPPPGPTATTAEEEDPASQLANLAALLQQQQQGSNSQDAIVGAVAAQLSAKAEPTKDDKEYLLQSLLSESKEGKKPSNNEWIDQATAATALQMLGLSTQQQQQQQQQEGERTEQQEEGTKKQDADNVMLIANYPGLAQAALELQQQQLRQQQQQNDESSQEYKRGSWTPEEDEQLIAGIKRFGYGRWKEIASLIPGRKGKQLKQRWDNTLAAKFVDTEWLKNKIRGDEEEWSHDIDVEGSAPPSPSKRDDKSTGEDIMAKITEKAKEGNQEAIEALLSQALLGTIHNNGAQSSTTSEPLPTTSSPLPAEENRLHHPPSAPLLTFADAATLALYAQQFAQAQQQQQQQQQHESSRENDPSTTAATSSPLAALASHPYFLANPFAQSGNDNAAAVAAAVAAMASAASQHHHHQQQQQQHPCSSTTTATTTTQSPSPLPQLPGFPITNPNRPPPKPAPRAAPGQKRRRSDPALAETQSAAMSIYASSAPITTTINNQTQTVYPCLFPNCGKTFARLYNLKSHSRTHTDDRPFVCNICQTAFSRNHDLKRHTKIHGGDKPHKCNGCNKTFSRLDALKRHKSNQRNKATCFGP